MITADFLRRQFAVREKNLIELRRESPEGRRLSLEVKLRKQEAYTKALEGLVPFDSLPGCVRAFHLPRRLFAIDAPEHYCVTTSAATFKTRWASARRGNFKDFRKKK